MVRATVIEHLNLRAPCFIVFFLPSGNGLMNVTADGNEALPPE